MESQSYAARRLIGRDLSSWTAVAGNLIVAGKFDSVLT
jgi:hypothetical protein